MNKTKQVVLAIMLSCLPFAGCAQESATVLVDSATNTAKVEQARQETSQQTTFGLENKVDAPVTIPKDVFMLLELDEENQRTLRFGGSSAEMPPSWFVASEVDLNNDKTPDLIVQSVDSRLWGANIGPFWVFNKTGAGYKLVLRVNTLIRSDLGRHSISYLKSATGL